MRPEAYLERRIHVDGWQVRLSSYRLEDVYYCKADNVMPGTWLARTKSHCRVEAEQRALLLARALLPPVRPAVQACFELRPSVPSLHLE
jgi:hypothetical protein